MSKVLVTGVSVIDFIFKLEQMPQEPEKFRAEEAVISGGGVAANAAVAISKLGGEATLVSRIGKDDIGCMIKKQLIKDASFLEKAGSFAIVLECIEKNLSKKITNTLKIPTIGIGSSHYCDGQILVTDDLLGLTNSKIKFVKKYIDLKIYIRKGVKKFKSDVLKNKYPNKRYSY